MSVADTTAPPATAYYSVAGHIFGLGEQQVYLVRSSATLTIRYRDARNSLHSQTFHQESHSSIAWTVEGFSSSGGPILAVALLPAAGSASPTAAPSPALSAAGIGSASGALASLSWASFMLSSLTAQLPDVGTQWSSQGSLALRYGVLGVSMNNQTIKPLGTTTDVIQIVSTGGTALHSIIATPVLGWVELQGKGGAGGSSYIEPQNRLLLGMTLRAFNYGRASAKRATGTYDLNVSMAMKLFRFVPGVPVSAAAPAFFPGSAYIGSTEPPDTTLYSTAAPEQVASPAATNTEFIPGPAQAVTPYPSALPEVSLPPIPIPWSSGQPVASPPPPPTPTPTPTPFYY
jgi:hypothetical protein